MSIFGPILGFSLDSSTLSVGQMNEGKETMVRDSVRDDRDGAGLDAPRWGWKKETMLLVATHKRKTTNT